MGSLPPPATINHIRETIDDGTTQVSAARRQTSSSLPVATNNTTDITTPAPGFTKSFTAGLPPVPTALSKRIQGEKFINMAELTVDYLSMRSYEEPSKSTQSKRRPVTSIIE